MITEKNYQRRKRTLNAAIKSIDVVLDDESNNALIDWTYNDISVKDLKGKIPNNLLDLLKEYEDA